jgi:hypothetical protein
VNIGVGATSIPIGDKTIQRSAVESGAVYCRHNLRTPRMAPREIQLGAPYWITPISKDGAEQRLASSM